MPSNHMQRAALTSLIVTAIGLGPALNAGQTGMPSVQYRSPAGVEYRSLPDTDAIRNARAALAAEPKNISRVIDLGVAESGARQFREAIATFSRGLEIEPNNALLLRWRGHRYLSVREFDRAFADLTRGSKIDATIYGIWYHLGVVQFVRGDFAGAAASFARAQPIAPDAAELAGATDWLWMSLSRAGRWVDIAGASSWPSPSQVSSPPSGFPQCVESRRPSASGGRAVPASAASGRPDAVVARGGRTGGDNAGNGPARVGGTGRSITAA